MPDNLIHQILSVSRKLNAVDDVAIGGTPNVTTGTARFGGQLGAKLCLTHEDAARMSDLTVGLLYGGVYQYVKVWDHAHPIRGHVAFYWNVDARLNFRVTSIPPPGTGCIAGIFINHIHGGYYGFIQTKGLASIQYAWMITKTSPQAQDLVICRNNDDVGEVLDDATPLTSVEVRSILGVASDQPVENAIGLVELRPGFDNF